MNRDITIYDQHGYSIAVIHHWHIASIVICQYMIEHYPILVMCGDKVLWNSDAESSLDLEEIENLVSSRMSIT